MRGTKAKRLRRENTEFKPKQLFKPLTIEIKGKEVYIPRRQRRLIMRKMMTDIRKGRFDFNKLREPEEGVKVDVGTE